MSDMDPFEAEIMVAVDATVAAARKEIDALRARVATLEALVREADDALLWASQRSPEAAATMVREARAWQSRARAALSPAPSAAPATKECAPAAHNFLDGECLKCGFIKPDEKGWQNKPAPSAAPATPPPWVCECRRAQKGPSGVCFKCDAEKLAPSASGGDDAPATKEEP